MKCVGGCFETTFDAGDLCARHGIDLLVLFGSRAKGRAVEGSDTDIGARRADRRRMTGDEFGALAGDLAAAFVAEPDLVDLCGDAPDLIYQVALHGRRLAGSDGAWAEFRSLAMRKYDDNAGRRRRRAEWLRKGSAGAAPPERRRDAS